MCNEINLITWKHRNALFSFYGCLNFRWQDEKRENYYLNKNIFLIGLPSWADDYDTKPMMNYKENEKSIASTNFVKDDFC